LFVFWSTPIDDVEQQSQQGVNHANKETNWHPSIEHFRVGYETDQMI